MEDRDQRSFWEKCYKAYTRFRKDRERNERDAKGDFMYDRGKHIAESKLLRTLRSLVGK